MTSLERAQAVAMLSVAEAMKNQALALLAMAEAQIGAITAQLGAETPTLGVPLNGDQLLHGSGRPYYKTQPSQPSQE